MREKFLSCLKISRSYGRASVNSAYILCERLVSHPTKIPKIYRRASINFNSFLGYCKFKYFAQFAVEVSLEIVPYFSGWVFLCFAIMYNVDLTLSSNMALHCK